MKTLTGLFKKKEQISEEEKQKRSAKDWLPIVDIQKDIVMLKDGSCVRIIEIMPINFKLKSRADKKFLILNYRSFLKACKFPMQISIQCKKADVDPHINRVQAFTKIEKNETVKNMIRGYIKLVRSLSYGSKSAISRRFFLIIPYVAPYGGGKEVVFSDVIKQITEKVNLIKEFLNKCGNEINEMKDDTETVANIIYTYLNKRTCEVQKFSGKLLGLSGVFLNAEWNDDDGDDEGDDEE